jgi:hypothetical protein
MWTIRLGRRLAAVAVLAAGLSAAAPASPAAAAACPAASTGVTVVVDFTGLGGGVAVRCAPGDPASGLAALQATGFAVTNVAVQPGFVCRIDGRPSDDQCQRVPPLTAYWSYWYADRGGAWTYSSLGAAGRDPAPGTVEGWAFGAGDRPSLAPPAPPPDPVPPPAGPDPPPAGPDPPPPAGDPPERRGEPGPGRAAAGSDADPGGSGPAGPATRVPGTAGPARLPLEPAPAGPASGLPGGGPDPPGTAPPAAGTATGPGDWGGVVVTAAVVAGLAGIGWWTAYRRGRAARG